MAPSAQPAMFPNASAGWLASIWDAAATGVNPAAACRGCLTGKHRLRRGRCNGAQSEQPHRRLLLDGNAVEGAGILYEAVIYPHTLVHRENVLAHFRDFTPNGVRLRWP